MKKSIVSHAEFWEGGPQNIVNYFNGNVNDTVTGTALRKSVKKLPHDLNSLVTSNIPEIPVRDAFFAMSLCAGG